MGISTGVPPVVLSEGFLAIPPEIVTEVLTVLFSAISTPIGLPP